MKLAIMQPYVFPYIGYFHLISSVDRFVVYDDVTFIKQGWINRNRILANGGPLLFSIPLSGAGSHVLIRDVAINSAEYHPWRTRFLKTLDQYYRKAPYFKDVMSLIQDTLDGSPEYIAHLAVRSLKSVCAFLGMPAEFVESSAHYGNGHLKSQERVIDICRREGAEVYINAIGGSELYSREYFRSNGIELAFLKPGVVLYDQFKEPFVPWLSVIDVLMFNPPEKARQYLGSYDLV